MLQDAPEDSFSIKPASSRACFCSAQILGSTIINLDLRGLAVNGIMGELTVFV